LRYISAPKIIKLEIKPKNNHHAIKYSQKESLKGFFPQEILGCRRTAGRRSDKNVESAPA
jgi:hypothetical protein